MIVSVMSSIFSVGYALISNIPWLLAAVVLYGLFWSALLSASGAYMTSTIPEHRRAEGISYWGLDVHAGAGRRANGRLLGLPPRLARLCVELVTLNLLMAIIAWRLPDDRASESSLSNARGAPPPRARPASARRLALLGRIIDQCEWAPTAHAPALRRSKTRSPRAERAINARWGPRRRARPGRSSTGEC